MKTFYTFVAIVGSISLGASSFAQEAKAPAGNAAVHGTVAELSMKGFNTLFTALSKTEFSEKVTSGTYTVLAPTDVAFRDMPKAELDALLADKEKLTAVISRHLVEGKVSAADLQSGLVKTLAGTVVSAKMVDGKLKIGNATVVRPDLATANGVIHGIDKVLQP
jgi:uncharacterized surface protein with fasciclin (FAS1) repeats